MATSVLLGPPRHDGSVCSTRLYLQQKSPKNSLII